MSAPPNQNYGRGPAQQPGQQPHMRPHQPRGFRPFNPGQQPQQMPNQGPPSGNAARPQGFAGPRGSPANGNTPMQFRGPPSNGSHSSMTARGAPSPSQGMRGPSSGGQPSPAGLNNQFNNMSFRGPPASPQQPQMRGAPPANQMRGPPPNQMRGPPPSPSQSQPQVRGPNQMRGPPGQKQMRGPPQQMRGPPNGQQGPPPPGPQGMKQPPSPAPQGMQQGPPPPGQYMQQPPPQGPSNPPRGPAYATGNFQQSNDMMGHAKGPGMQGYAPPMHGQAQQPVLSEEQIAAQCHKRYMKPTVSVLPHSQEDANKSKLSFGIVIRPLAPQPEDDPIDVVNFGQAGVVRCRYCRSYVNPFVQWVDNGRRFRCNICGTATDVPSAYYCHLDASQQRQDRFERPELSKGSIEIIAPSEYLMRPPQPPCYIFVLDVSAQSVASGMLQQAAATIRAQLDNLPGSPRTRVGFLTYDNAIHFYNLKPTLKAPQMMVVSDLEELFIPIPDELLVNLSDSREMVEMLLETLPSIHANANRAETALGSAIRVAFKLMSPIGGKMMVFQSALPTTGAGALRHREDPRILGTDKEHSLLNPVDTYYRTNAIDFNRQQITVDMFLCANQYTDVASLGSLVKFSGGQLHYYPGFDAEVHGEKLDRDLTRCLTRETAWEGVIRVRCTKGMRLTNFYGNAFLRGPDLLALPTTHADAAFAVEIAHSDSLLSSSTVSVQAGTLYTNSGGERRIRVHTICLPVSKLYAELFRSVDMDAMCNLMAKNALEASLKTGLSASRANLQQQCADIVRAYRGSGAYGTSQSAGYQLQLPDSLQLLPLYVMSLLKNPALRGGVDLNSDERAFAQSCLNNMPASQSKYYIYPRLFPLHELPTEAGKPCPAEDDSFTTAGDKKIVLPPVLNLSIERMGSEGVYLLDDALTFYLWVGRSAPAPLLHSLFGTDSLEGVDCHKVKLKEPHDELSARVHAMLDAIREDRSLYQQVTVMREGDPSEGRFFWRLVEDRASFDGGSYSYSEYLGQINRQSMGAAK